jgi:hypothetical protein
MDDQVRVHAAVRPVVQRREVGDRRHGRDVEVAGHAHPAEDLGRAGIGRHDHVGLLL